MSWASALEAATDVQDVDPAEVSDFIDALEKLDRKGRGPADEALRDVQAATVEAYVHLDSEEARFLRDVQSLSAEMREHIDTLLVELACAPGGEDLRSISAIRSAAREVRSSIRELLDRGAAALQPIARIQR